MLKSESKTINGCTYEVTQLPYKLGHKLLFRLGKTIGPAMAEALGHAPQVGEMDLGEVSVAKVAPALASGLKGLFDSMDETDFDWMVDTLAEYSKISTDGGPAAPLRGKMEFHYAGNYGEFFEWLWFALTVNFSGMFGGQGKVAALLAGLKVAAPKAETSRGG